MIKSGDQIDMLDVVWRDPIAPTSAEREPLLTPRAEEPIIVPTPNDSPTSEPE